MPRLDRTFSGRDIIRIWERHLTRDEQREVLCFFCILCEAETGEVPPSEIVFALAALLFRFVPVVGPAFAQLFRALDLLEDLLDTREGLPTPDECVDTFSSELREVIRELLEEDR